MPGSLRELRIRAYLDLLQERDSRLAPAVPDPGQDQPGGNGEPTDPPDADGGPGGGTGGNGGPGPGPQPGPAGPARRAGKDRGPAVAALINLTVPLDTVLGLSATPGEVAGFGPLDPSDARARGRPPPPPPPPAAGPPGPDPPPEGAAPDYLAGCGSDRLSNLRQTRAQTHMTWSHSGRIGAYHDMSERYPDL